MTSEPRCDLTELLVSQCGHCTGADKPEPPEYGPWFAAAYPGMCADCHEQIEPQDRIRADGEGGYLCAGCGRELDRP